MFNPDSVKMSEKKAMEFEAFDKMQRLPYVMYADTECYLEKDPEDDKVTHHIPCSIGLLLVPHPEMCLTPCSPDQNIWKRHVYSLIIMSERFTIGKVNTSQKPLLTFADKKQFTETAQCYILNKSFNKELPQVFEHDYPLLLLN